MTRAVTITPREAVERDGGPRSILIGSVRHTFEATFDLVPALELTHGRWINRYAPGAVQPGYWVAARFTRVTVSGMWRAEAEPSFSATAHGHTLRKDGRQSAQYARRWSNRLTDDRHRDELTPPEILAVIDQAEQLAASFDGWRLSVKLRCGCARSLAERIGEHPLSCPALALKTATPSRRIPIGRGAI